MLEVGWVSTVEVLEYAILVLKTAVYSLRGAVLDSGEGAGLGAGRQGNARQSLRRGCRRRRSPGQHIVGRFTVCLVSPNSVGVGREGSEAVLAEAVLGLSRRDT